MSRGSKYNLYKCPECTYGTPRKYNLKMHMLRMHGMDSSPYQYKSQKAWVWEQRRKFEQAYLEANTEKEVAEAWRKLNNFLIGWGRKGLWNFLDEIPKEWKARDQHEQALKLKRRSSKSLG
jgi:hypothetical protein